MAGEATVSYEHAAWKGYQQWVVELPDGTAYYEIVEPDGSVYPVGPPIPRDLLPPGSVDFLSGWAASASTSRKESRD